MYYYTIEDGNQKVYKNYLFSSLSSADDMIEKLERETGEYYYLASMRVID